MTNHGGKIDKSTRLDRMYQTLNEFGTASTLQLQKMTGDLACSTTISDLRKAGVPIPPAEYLGKTQEGRKIYLYRMVEKKA